MKFKIYLLVVMISLIPKVILAAPYVIPVTELDFTDFLPITGSCEMDIAGVVTDLPGSQMCIGSDSATIAHYRIIALPNTNFSIQVKTRNPENGDGLTFSPIGKITSDIDDITIVPGQAHIANSGTLGKIDIKFGGQIIISNAFNASMSHKIEMEAAITWSEVP